MKRILLTAIAILTAYSEGGIRRMGKFVGLLAPVDDLLKDDFWSRFLPIMLIIRRLMIRRRDLSLFRDSWHWRSEQYSPFPVHPLG